MKKNYRSPNLLKLICLFSPQSLDYGSKSPKQLKDYTPIRFKIETAESIINSSTLTPELKINFFLRKFQEGRITDIEIWELLKVTTENDTAANNKVVQLLLEYGKTDLIVLEKLISVLRVSPDISINKTILVTLSNLISQTSLVNDKILKELVPIIINQIKTDYSPYLPSIVPSAQQVLSNVLTVYDELLSELFEAIKNEKSDEYKLQLVTVLHLLAIRNPKLRKKLVFWVTQHKKLFKDFEEVISNFDSKRDPKKITIKQSYRTISLFNKEFGLHYLISFLVILAILLFLILKIEIILNVIGIPTDNLIVVSDFFKSLAQNLASISIYFKLPKEKEEILDTLNLVIRNNWWIIGAAVTFLVFAIREINAKYSRDILKMFLLVKHRLFLLILIFTSFFGALVIHDIYQSTNNVPNILYQFCLISKYLSPLLLLLLIIDLIFSIWQKSVLVQYINYHSGKIKKISLFEGQVSKNKLEQAKGTLNYRFIFFDHLPKSGRNQYLIEASSNGIVAEIKSSIMIKIDKLLSTINESFEQYGKTFSISELQILNDIGTEVILGKEIVAFYSDQSRLSDELKTLCQKAIKIKFDKKFQKFKEFVDSIISYLKNAIMAEDLSSIESLLINLRRVIKIILETKRKKLKKILESSSRTIFSAFDENEVIFLEAYIFRMLKMVAIKIYSSNNSQMIEKLNHFYEDIIKYSIANELFSTIELCFWQINEIQADLYKKKEYDTLQGLLIFKSSLAKTFYSIDKTPSDISLRYDLQELLTKILSETQNNKELEKYLQNYFLSFEILASFILISQYFNYSKVLKCLSWLEETIQKYKAEVSISFYCMRTIYMIGALAFVKHRYFLAFRTALILADSEKATNCSIEKIYKFLAKRKNSLETINKLWGDLFNQNTIMNDLAEYNRFVKFIIK